DWGDMSSFKKVSITDRKRNALAFKAVVARCYTEDDEKIVICGDEFESVDIVTKADLHISCHYKPISKLLDGESLVKELETTIRNHIARYEDSSKFGFAFGPETDHELKKKFKAAFDMLFNKLRAEMRYREIADPAVIFTYPHTPIPH